MATLKEIKGRINTVNGTLKITSAMKMVASAKLHKAQDAMANLIPYERQMHGILCRLLSDESAPSCEEFAAQRQVRKAAIVAVASNSSLCGAFNANVIRLFNETAEGYLASGLTRDDILVFPVGRKMAEAASKAGFASRGDFNSLADKHVFGEVKAFAESLTDKFLRKEVDEVSLVYSHYKSSSSQEPVRETYLPFSAVSSMDVRISGSGRVGVAGPAAESPCSEDIYNASGCECGGTCLKNGRDAGSHRQRQPASAGPDPAVQQAASAVHHG